MERSGDPTPPDVEQALGELVCRLEDAYRRGQTIYIDLYPNTPFDPDEAVADVWWPNKPS